MTLTSMSASEMARLVRARQLSPVELVQAHLNLIESLNPAINAFIHLDAENALNHARAAEAVALRGSDLPLLGVPISIKSCIDVAGLPCPAGSRLRAGVVAPTDAPLVARLKHAGAIILGVTNTPELLMAYETDNLLHGPTSNPWDLARTAGGSSGGESAAIAAGLSAAGIGSDGGGSVRVPAHFTGICALKPTPGRIPGTGHFPPCAGPFALTGVVGPMARTVGDLQLMLDVLSGPDASDPMAAAYATQTIIPEAARSLPIGFYCGGDVTPETRDAVEGAAGALTNSGFRVEPFHPVGLDEAFDLWHTIFCNCGGMLVRDFVRGRESEVSPTLRKLIDHSLSLPPLTAEQLLNALIARDLLRARLLAQMQPATVKGEASTPAVLLLPVSTAPAFLHGQGGWDDRSPANYLRTMRYCQVFNLLGLPAAVVPVSRSNQNLPIGVQIVGRPYEEEAVLAVAAALEQHFGYQEPPLNIASAARS